jgi:hypothetical protein
MGLFAGVTVRSEASDAGLVSRDVCLRISRSFCAVWSKSGLKYLFDLRMMVRKTMVV